MFFTKEIPHMTSILPTVILLCLIKRCIYIFSLSKVHSVNEDVLLAIINLQAISGEPSSVCQNITLLLTMQTGCTVTIRTCSVFTASGLV